MTYTEMLNELSIILAVVHQLRERQPLGNFEDAMLVRLEERLVGAAELARGLAEQLEWSGKPT